MQDETIDAYHEGQLINDANYGEYQEKMNAPASATSILALMDTTKAERRSFAEQVIESIEQGNVNPLTIHVQLKATQSLIDQFLEKGEIKDRYMSLVLSESAKYPKRFEYHSATFEAKEVGVKYDYSKCGDPEMDSLLIEEKALKERIKDRETFLKGINGHIEIVDKSTGEMITIYPPAKSSTTSVAVTVK